MDGDGVRLEMGWNFDTVWVDSNEKPNLNSRLRNMQAFGN